MTDASWDLGATVARARREGGRLVGRIARDMGALVAGNTADLTVDLHALQRDVRGLADRALRDLEVRAAHLVDVFERQLETASEMLLKRLSAATRREIDALGRRIATLEKRVRSVERGARARARSRELARGTAGAPEPQREGQHDGSDRCEHE